MRGAITQAAAVLILVATACGGDDDANRTPASEKPAASETTAAQPPTSPSTSTSTTSTSTTTTAPSTATTAPSPPPGPPASDSDAIAAGFIAACNDGNYSNNSDFDKTCSGGDGINHWLAPFGSCKDGAFIAMSPSSSCDNHGGFASLQPPGFVPQPRPTDVARCKTGLYSDNTDFASTCSGNGGVGAWLAPYGQCADGWWIQMSGDVSCDGHGGFAGLLPADFIPPTQDVVTRALGSIRFGEVRGVEVTGSGIVITIKAPGSLTDGTTKDVARIAVADALKAIQQSNVPPTIASGQIIIFGDLQNEFGEVTEEQVIDATYSRATIDRIVFDNIDPKKILLLADFANVHPAYAKGDGS
jgi:hypothetical protein